MNHAGAAKRQAGDRGTLLTGVGTRRLRVVHRTAAHGDPEQVPAFPGRDHWVLKPANSILWHDTVLDWLDLWTRRDGKDCSFISFSSYNWRRRPQESALRH
jgi:hypothetical protein